MTLREMCSSYSLLQRISKIGDIACENKDRSTVDRSASIFLFLIYNYIIFP